MRSVDTNILVRVLLKDDVVMAERAARVIAEPAMVLPGVVMETVWALRSAGGWPRAAIHQAIVDLMTVPTLRFAEAARVQWALDRYARGADFADMLHLASSGAADSFATMDTGIARFADDDVVPVETF